MPRESLVNVAFSFEKYEKYIENFENTGILFAREEVIFIICNSNNIS